MNLSAVYAQLGRPTTFPKGSNQRSLHLGTESLYFLVSIISCTYFTFVQRTMWPSPSPAWQPSSYPYPGTSTIRLHSSPPTSWSPQPTLLFPGVPQGHPPTHSIHRDQVPPGYQFSTPSTLETPPSHSDPTLYMPSQHHHPVFQPVLGIPPTEPPTTLDHHNETFSDMVRRYPSRLHGLQLATLNLPGQLQRQRFHHKYLNITNLHNLQLHLFQPRHRHHLQARHLQHPLHDHRPRPNGPQALLPGTEETSPSTRP